MDRELRNKVLALFRGKKSAASQIFWHEYARLSNQNQYAKIEELEVSKKKSIVDSCVISEDGDSCLVQCGDRIYTKNVIIGSFSGKNFAKKGFMAMAPSGKF